MKIKELLSSPDKWTKGATARNKYGENVSPLNTEAVCWCLLGAVRHCYNSKDKLSIYKRIGKEIEDDPDFYKIYPFRIPMFNDSAETTFEDIKKLVNKLDI